MGASIGEPKGPIPVLIKREKGLSASFGRYARRNDGPESKKVPRPRESSLESPAERDDWKGKPKMLRGILALKRGFCSSLNFSEAFIFLFIEESAEMILGVFLMGKKRGF